MKKVLVLCGLMAAVSTLPAAAATISFDNSTPQSTAALTGIATSGDMMDGMLVTVTSGAGSITTAWADGAAGCGSAAGSLGGFNWSLAECGDTFVFPWTFTADAGAGITSFFVDAGIGGTVFDMTEPFVGTAGSAQGLTFTTASTLAINVTFSGPVGVGGAPPVGDLYRYMQVSFGSPFAGSLSFSQDADNLVFRDITPTTPVPEPASMLMLGGGLAAAAIRRRRARRA